MTKKRKLALIVLLAILVLVGCWYYNHFYTGCRLGKVVDAVTGKPIEGAVVCMQWFTGGFLTVAGGTVAAFYETVTDANGKYFIPTQRLKRALWYEGVHKEDVLIYKDGYSGYQVSGTSHKQVGRSFGHNNEEYPYRRKWNQVELFPFDGSYSHHDHLRWLETPIGIYGSPELLEKELQKEIEREDQEYKRFRIIQ